MAYLAPRCTTPLLPPPPQPAPRSPWGLRHTFAAGAQSDASNAVQVHVHVLSALRERDGMRTCADGLQPCSSRLMLLLRIGSPDAPIVPICSTVFPLSRGLTTSVSMVDWMVAASASVSRMIELLAIASLTVPATAMPASASAAALSALRFQAVTAMPWDARRRAILLPAGGQQSRTAVVRSAAAGRVPRVWIRLGRRSSFGRAVQG